MHYLPETTRAILEEGVDSQSTLETDRRSIHWLSAPLYALTLAVGLLLAADAVLGFVAIPQWTAWRSVMGFRLALLAAVLGGARILFQTLDGLMQGRIGADLALAIACLAAILLGEHQVAALVVFIALVGESIEGYTVDRAVQAIRRAYDLCPRFAHVLRSDGEHDIPVAELQPGDQVIVRPGERVPADGDIVAGATAIDQSALTGESLPVDRHPGDRVFAGTLNQFGVITVTVTKVGAQSTFGQIIGLVQQSTREKAPLEREADRLARYFLPVILGAALLTLIGWKLRTGTWNAGWLPALSVLVVACPCPLILATPSAVLAAMAWLARSGVVIKGSAALERLATIDTVAFDKTGTLTTGQLRLGTVLCDEFPETEFLRLAAAASRNSDHPLSRLVVAAADRQGVVVPRPGEFQEYPGLGVWARLEESVWPPESLRSVRAERPGALVVGSGRWLKRCGIEVTEVWEERLRDLDVRGESIVLVGVSYGTQPAGNGSLEPAVSQDGPGGRVLGVLGIVDTARPQAAEVVAQLRNAGITQIALLTGDRAGVARSLAEQVAGLDECHAELLPADKAQWVQQQAQAGRRVAMVGDGINDAPALGVAQVGIAIGNAGSDLAAEAGDVILLGDPLAAIPGLLRLSRAMVRTIRRGILIFAFGVNALGVLLSAWGWLNPVGSALFHEGASLAVMLHALQLVWFERWNTTSVGAGLHRLGSWGSAAADWVSPTGWVYYLLRHRRKLLPLSGALVAAWWLTTNLVLIRSDEQALVNRFGRFHEVLSPGIYWRWPTPLEQIRRERVNELRSLTLGFRPRLSPARLPGDYRAPVEWQTAHDDQGVMTLPEEGLLLTGDELLVELTAEAQYRISNLQEFVAASADPAATLRGILESSVRDVIARRSLESILAESRWNVETACLAKAQAILKRNPLGLELAGIHLLDVHPPGPVVSAYRDVANALEEREQALNLGQALATRTLMSAAGEQAMEPLSLAVRPSSALPAEANSPTPAESEPADRNPWTLDEIRWMELTAEEPVGGVALSGESAARLNAARSDRARRVEQARGAASRFEKLVGPHRAFPHLTSTALYWNAVETALTGRPVIIVDPQVKGRRQIWLVDPRDREPPPRTDQRPLPAETLAPEDSP